jgi:hypothetical protein
MGLGALAVSDLAARFGALFFAVPFAARGDTPAWG